MYQLRLAFRHARKTTMDKQNRSLIGIAVALAALILGLLYFLRKEPLLIQDLRKESDEQNQNQANSHTTPRSRQGEATSKRLYAKSINASEAKRLISSALFRIVNAKAYRMVMVSASNAGSSSVALLHFKSPTRGDLFRTETVSYDTTLKPMSGLNRVEITNERGNWEIRDSPGEEGIAFLLKDAQEPIDTVGFHKRFEMDANQIASDANSVPDYISDGLFHGRPVVNIKYSGQVYSIDAESRELLSIYWGARLDFELNPTLDEAQFNIPESDPVVEVSDMMAAERYLQRQK